MRLLIIVVFIALWVSFPAAAQVELFEPPIITVELSGYEPTPPGVISEIGWVGWGGGPQGEPVQRVQWVKTPPTSVFPSWSVGEFTACGYDSIPPRATLTIPDGTEYSITDGSVDGDCWSTRISGHYGMEMGRHTLLLEHASGDLFYEWDVEYPDHPVESRLIYERDRPQQIALMGFEPNAQVIVQFYGPEGYIATRPIEVDRSGTVMIDLRTSRSSPFAAHQVRLMFEDYNKETVKPIYAYNLVPRASCPGSPLSRLVVGELALVTPGDPNRVRSAPESGEVIGRLDGGTDMIQIIDGPRCGAENGLTWWKVKFYDLVGWTPEGGDGEYWMLPMF